jgi:drug/metabolite transporter (DMT)-like permease
MARRREGNLSGRRAAGQGHVLVLLISILIWVGIGIAVRLVYLEGPITVVERAVLMIAAAVELILLRHVWRTTRRRNRFRDFFARMRAGAHDTRPSLLKQTALLAGLVGTYLHYYFWDVNLQIASLKSVTVFV